MKIKVLLIVLCSFFLTGVVSAANLWGTFYGNQIIRLTVDGNPVQVNESDVPAISYGGRTMIPIYLLKEAGVDFTWDQQNQTVNIIKQPSPPIVTIDNSYSFDDAVKELGFRSSSTITVAAREIALDLMEIRKTKKESDYSVQDALLDLGLQPGSIPTLDSLRQALRLISLR